MKFNKINRRNFIRSTSLASLGAASTGMVKANTSFVEKKEVSIKEYRKFGKTGFKTSDISSGNPSNEVVLKTLLNKGINLIDTGESYGNGNSERLIGQILPDYKRKDLFINSKLYAEKEFPSKQDVIDRTEKCLERLQTDYLDCMMIHSAETSAILKDEAFHLAMEELKKQGKVRHVGVSCHGNALARDTSENLEKIMLAAIEDGRFDVLLLTYNFVNAPMAEKVLEACDKKNIATMIMKSNPVYIYGLMEKRVENLTKKGEEIDENTKALNDKYKVMNDSAKSFFKDYNLSGEQEVIEAASKFVLSNPLAHTTIWDFKNLESVEKMLKLSGTKLNKQEKLVLDGYQNRLGKYSCRIGCNDCESACPHGLPVNKILRYNYYFEVKKQEKRAIEKYSSLNTKKLSLTCANCEGHCEQACKFGVLTRSLLALAEQNMRLS